MSDEVYVELVERLDDRVAAVDGHGFRVTPFYRSDALSTHFGFDSAGGVWVKDETSNVSGSHKARHLMGVMIHLLVSEAAGITDPASRPTLAIASCGNAALGAAVVAAAERWPLRVYVPSDADSSVLSRLADLGAAVVVCDRRVGEEGDPTLRRLLDGIGARQVPGIGARQVPFTCQGNLNALSIEGGSTLAYEIIAALANIALTADHIVVQVGGGALATATIRAFDDALDAGLLAKTPRIHTLQPAGAHPLERAYTKLKALAGDHPRHEDVERLAADAARHRSAYMWPWDHPASVASGIIDDETYDWVAVVKGMLRSAGTAIVAGESDLRSAHAVAGASGIAASPTGTAGLAGVASLIETGTVQLSERVIVLVTGAQRD